MPDYAKAPTMADDDSKVAATEPQHENMLCDNCTESKVLNNSLVSQL